MTLTRSNFTIYAEHKAAIAELEAKLEELKPLIVAEIEELSDPVDLEGYGIFSLVPKKSWKYTDAVEFPRLEVKMKEREEQQTGAATYEINNYLLFKPAK